VNNQTGGEYLPLPASLAWQGNLPVWRGRGTCQSGVAGT